jgi:hypothetical protein
MILWRRNSSAYHSLGAVGGLRRNIPLSITMAALSGCANALSRPSGRGSTNPSNLASLTGKILAGGYTFSGGAGGIGSSIAEGAMFDGLWCRDRALKGRLGRPCWRRAEKSCVKAKMSSNPAGSISCRLSAAWTIDLRGVFCRVSMVCCGKCRRMCVVGDRWLGRIGKGKSSRANARLRG